MIMQQASGHERAGHPRGAIKLLMQDVAIAELGIRSLPLKPLPRRHFSAAFRQRRRRLRRLPRAERIFAAEPRHVQVSNSRFNSPFKILPLGLRGNGSGQKASFTGTLEAERIAAPKSRNSASGA